MLEKRRFIFRIAPSAVVGEQRELRVSLFIFIFIFIFIFMRASRRRML